MNQNDYVILFDENGTPYISHGLLDNAKSAVNSAAQKVTNVAKGVGRGIRENHEYILKVFENGKARYFYTQDEVKAYYQAKRLGIKNAADYAKKAVSSAKDAAKSTVDKAQNAFESQAAKVKDAVTTRTDDVRNKLNDMQQQHKTEKELSAAEKRKKATEDYYQERRSSGFRDNRSILGSLNKGRSDYSNESIDTKIASALKADGVDMIESSDPKIRQAQNSIVNSRKSLEQHTLDYEHAQKYSEEAAKRAERAEEAYWAIVGDGTSSQDAIRQAKKIMRDAAADKKQSDRDIKQLEKMLDDDQKAYHSAIQIYNMQLHINKTK